MRNTVMIPALLALSVGLAACSHQPNVNLENAKTNFSALQTNPEATKVAALETKDASEWLAIPAIPRTRRVARLCAMPTAIRPACWWRGLTR